MGAGKKTTRCEVDFTPTALDDLNKLDIPTRERIFSCLDWLAAHHDRIRHEGLKYLHEELVWIEKTKGRRLQDTLLVLRK